MSGWLLDTNVISELRKPSCQPSVRAWAEAQAPETLHLSRITIADLLAENAPALDGVAVHGACAGAVQAGSRVPA